MKHSEYGAATTEAQLDQAPGPVPASAPSAGASWKEKSLNSFDNCFNGNINYEFYDLYDFFKILLTSSTLFPCFRKPQVKQSIERRREQRPQPAECESNQRRGECLRLRADM